MSIMNFSVPPEVKDAFDRAFAGENKSAVLTELMRQAVEERKRPQRRARAIEKLLEWRQQVTPRRAQVIRSARLKGRP